MKVGIGVADLTPLAPLTLPGFIARQNKPSEGIADPLHVRGLAPGDDSQFHLLFAFDLIGIGTELLGQLNDALTKEFGSRFSSQTRTGSGLFVTARKPLKRFVRSPVR